MNQQTISHKFELEGIGLHTGKMVKMTCLPGEVNSGIVFKRIDLEGEPLIPASIAIVDSTYRSTSLKKGEDLVTTTEHLLSACYGLSIDNLLIELNLSLIHI